LTQEQLALQISCSTSALRKIEAEQRRPSAQIVEQLAEVFNVASSERKPFLKFARGDWQAAPTGVDEDTPWLVAPLREYEIPSEREDLSNPKIHLATFLFTDIEGSTKLWESAPEKMKSALQRHHAILQEAISSNSGTVFQITGDAFCAAFQTALSAISAVVTAQRGLHQEPWDLSFPIRVRMGIHTGEAEQTSNDLPTGGYASNPTMNRVARIHSAGHGGQVLLSLVTKELVKDSLPADAELRDMGEHHFKYLISPERLFQLNIAGLPSDFPPLNTRDSARHNLPLQLTSFIGREREIMEIIGLLENARMVSLIGPGGTGKTRLSIQVANEVLDQYPDGAWFVELAPISDPLLLPRTTSIAIGLRDEPHRPVIDMLCDYLHDKQLLLILDNCEHLVEACAELADRLLHACPQIRILATSREVVGIAGETSYLVPSLQLPDMQNLPTVEALSQCEAVRLFIERASAATQKFRVTNDNASSIAQICHHLDGMPLAIELAAGKIRALSAGQIAQRLDDRFRLLTGGSRTAMPRHQTLQAAIEWSYDLLSPAEQTLFRRLSVFVNGWTLEAAESVCSDQDTTAKGALKAEDVLELVTQLVNKSLVMTEERNSEVRYHMLETIRQFGSDKLVEANESESLRDQHLEFFTRFVETADLFLRRAEQIEWLQRLDNEHDNLRSVLQWALGKSSAEPALQLVGSLAAYWTMRCFWLEGAKWLESALNKPSVGLEEMTKSEKGVRAKAFYGDSMLIFNLDDLDRMQTSAETSLNLYKELGDPRGIAFARAWLGYALVRRSDSRAAHLLEKSLAEFRELKDPAGQYFSLQAQLRDYHQIEGAKKAKEVALEVLRLARISENRFNIAHALMSLAEFYFLCGQLDQAVTTQNEANELFKSFGSRDNFILPGVVAYLRHDYDRAKEYFTKTINEYEPLGEKITRSMALFWLGVTYQDEGNLEQARAFLEKALAIQEEVGRRHSTEATPYTLFMLGKVLGQLGDLEKATMMSKEGLLLVKEFNFEFRKAEILILNAWLFIERSPQAATSLLATVTTKYQNMDVPMHPVGKIYYERYLAAARSKLDEKDFNAAWAEGEKMEINQAIDYALSKIEEIEKDIQAK
jgi:predicted ATPase/class 3 adenylate cyclase